MPPPTKSLLKKEESADLFDDGIDWSQVSDAQFDTQFDTQTHAQSQTQSQTQVETQTTLVGKPSLAKLAHSFASPSARTISVESGTSVQTNDSAKTLIVVDDEDVDYRALLEGAENVDWNDWGSDEENKVTTTPRKLKSPSKSKKFTPVKPKNLKGVAGGAGALAITPPPYTKQCTRCIVVNITRYDQLDDPVLVSRFLSSSVPLFPRLAGVSADRVGCLVPRCLVQDSQYFAMSLPKSYGVARLQSLFSHRVALFSRS